MIIRFPGPSGSHRNFQDSPQVLRNLFDDLRSASPSDTLAQCDLIGIALWLGLHASPNSQGPSQSTEISVWENLLKAPLSEVRTELREAIRVFTQTNPTLGKALSLIVEDSLKSVGDKEITWTLETISTLLFKSNPEDRVSLGDAYQSLFLQVRDGLEAHLSPALLGRLMVQLGRPTAEDRVYDPFAGLCGSLIESWKFVRDNAQEASNASHPALSGCEINQWAWARAQLLLAIFGIKATLDLADAHGHSESPRSPTLVLSEPPIGISHELNLSNRQAFRNRPGVGSPAVQRHFVGVFQALSDLEESRGRAVLVVSQRVIFGGGSVGRIRREWVDQDILEAVITLPRGLNLPFTNLAPCLLVLNLNKMNNRRGKFVLIDAESAGRTNSNARFTPAIFEEKIRDIVDAFRFQRSIPGFSIVVGENEFRSHDWDMSPARYMDAVPTVGRRVDLDLLIAEAQELDQAALVAQQGLSDAAQRLSIRLKARDGAR